MELKNVPIRIMMPEDIGPRLTREYTIQPEGFYFLELGWDTDSLNPFHLLPGQVTGEGPWKVGDIELQEVKPGDPSYKYFEDWEAYKKSKSWFTPERIQSSLEQGMRILRGS